MSDALENPRVSDAVDPGPAVLRRSGAWLAAVAITVLLPLVFQDSYWRGVLILCALNVLLALGLDIILGYAGQLNLGCSAFYGIGAYVSTVLVTKAGLGFWPAAAAGTLGAGLAGVALALFAVRLRGHYLAIASLGFAVITYQVLLNWISVTEGPLGIYGIPPPPGLTLPWFGRIDFSDQASLFYLIAGIAFLVYAVLRSLTRSPIGETLTALREDEVSASSLGINCPIWKLFAFGLGSAVTGLAGSLYAPFAGTLVPDAFTITEEFTVLAMVIVGGIGTLIGPVLGAVILTVLPELLRSLGDARMIIYGAALTVVVLFVPGGLIGAWELVARSIRRGSAR